MTQKEQLQKYTSECRHLVHASNLIRKHEEGKNIEALKAISTAYLRYIKMQTETIGFTKEIIKQRVFELNKYYRFLNDNKYNNVFTAQGKFRSTILEEFMFILFRDYIAHIKTKYGDSEDKLDSGSIKAYSNLYFTSANLRDFITEPEIKVNEKDQDFAIYRTINVSVDDSDDVRALNVPIVAIENKTYIDKTMLDSIMAVADKIKQGNPYVYFCSVTETYEVAFEVDPYYSNIDQIYVLRRARRSKKNDVYRDIDAQTVLTLFDDVRKHVERTWSDVKNKMETTGLIM